MTTTEHMILRNGIILGIILCSVEELLSSNLYKLIYFKSCVCMICCNVDMQGHFETKLVNANNPV